MPRFTHALITATAAAAAIAAPAASAAGSTELASPEDVQIEGAYAFLVTYEPSKVPVIRVVLRTRGQMPRRHDGLIRAAGRALGYTGAGSTSSVGGRKSRCYSFTIGLRDGRLITDKGKTGRKARGARLRVRFSTETAAGKAVSSTRAVTVRAKRGGDLSGKPLGC